jgi:hypothetical protein
MKTTRAHTHSFHELPDFSLVLGEPLFKMLVRLRLANPAFELMARRIVLMTLFAWLPLLILSLVDGKAWSGVGLPFLHDIEMQARFLIVLPLIIAAELPVHQQLSAVVGQFIERGIITEEVLPKFKQSIATGVKLRNSVAIELTLFILIFIGGYFLWSTISGVEKIGTDTGTWYAIVTNGGTRLSPAGYWYIIVSRPLVQFILIRWYLRLFVWARFLWQSSRLDLNLIPTHPDRAAGLGFLAASITVFTPLIIAHGVLLAGVLANPILFAGAKLTDFKLEIIVMVGFLLLAMLGPLLVFWPCLMRAKRAGLLEYGTLASRYVKEFDLKWIRDDAINDEKFIGSSDIQSLADLGNSFQVIRDIQPFPFGKGAVIGIILMALIPVSPLVFTMIPLEELIKALLGAIF